MSCSSFYGKQVLRARKTRGRRKRNAEESMQKEIFTRRNHYIQMYSSHGCFYSSPSYCKLWIGVIFCIICTFFWRVRLMSKSALSVRMYQRGFHWTDLCKTWYWRLLRKYVEKIQVWLKSGNNIPHSACIPKQVLLFPTILNRHKSAIFERNGINQV